MTGNPERQPRKDPNEVRMEKLQRLRRQDELGERTVAEVFKEMQAAEGVLPDWMAIRAGGPGSKELLRKIREENEKRRINQANSPE